jgi:hypothetical protein
MLLAHVDERQHGVGEPLFRNVAQDARFRAFLRKMNLPE